MQTAISANGEYCESKVDERRSNLPQDGSVLHAHGHYSAVHVWSNAAESSSSRSLVAPGRGMLLRHRNIRAAFRRDQTSGAGVGTNEEVGVDAIGEIADADGTVGEGAWRNAA